VKAEKDLDYYTDEKYWDKEYVKSMRKNLKEKVQQHKKYQKYKKYV
jgi:hypothetical protein